MVVSVVKSCVGLAPAGTRTIVDKVETSKYFFRFFEKSFEGEAYKSFLSNNQIFCKESLKKFFRRFFRFAALFPHVSRLRGVPVVPKCPYSQFFRPFLAFSAHFAPLSLSGAQKTARIALKWLVLAPRFKSLRVFTYFSPAACRFGWAALSWGQLKTQKPQPCNTKNLKNRSGLPATVRAFPFALVSVPSSWWNGAACLSSRW